MLEAVVGVHIAKKDHPEALRAAEKAIDVVQSVRKRDDKEKIWEGHMNHTVAMIHLVDQEFEKANTATQASLKILREVGDPYDQAVVLNTLTHIKNGLTDYGDAVRNAT